MRLARLAIAGVLLSPCGAQQAPDPLLTMEGEKLREVRQDDAMILSMLAASRKIAIEERDWYRAYRVYARLLLRSQGVEVTEATEAGAALDFQLERNIVIPGDRLGVRIQALFTLGHPLAARYVARVSVKSEGGETLESLDPIEIAQLRDYPASVTTSSLKPGKYSVFYELLTAERKPIVAVAREFLVVPDIARRVTSLRQKVERLKQMRVQERGVSYATAMETIEYTAGVLDRERRALTPMTTKLLGSTMKGYGGEPVDIDRDLALADELALGLLSRKDPLPTRVGDLHLAYRSGVDGALLPFRVFVPDGFDPSRKYPLIVALHGIGGDENTYMQSFFKNPAQERGYLLVAPNGGYDGASEQDVLDVIDRVLQVYPIAPGQVFLTGHSTGGAAAWRIGVTHRGRFAALAPVAPLGKLAPLKDGPALPILLSAGLNDTLFPPAMARAVADGARYAEYPGDHFTVLTASMKAIFDFFDEARR